MGGTPPHRMVFFLTAPPPHQNQCPPPCGTPHLKKKPPCHLKNKPPPLKSEASFQEMIPREILEKSEIVINTCVSVIKQHGKMMAEIPQESDFITWSI